jgi:putative protease
MYYSDCIVTAIVESSDHEGNAVVTQRNKFEKGDELELLTPTDEPIRFTVECMHDMNGNEIITAPHAMMEFHVKLPVTAPKYSILRKYK